MSELRLVVLVSSDKSDLFFANQLIKRANVVGVVVEDHGTSMAQKILPLLSHPLALISKITTRSIVCYRRLFMDYVAQCQREDEKEFGDEGHAILSDADCPIIHTGGFPRISEPDFEYTIRRIVPDLIAVCGTSILKDNILSIPPLGTLNLHGGLPQRYRGLLTTDWAVYNEEPEYIGATVHYISAGIDDGDIVFQGRPEVAAEDNPESLYIKVVKLGIEMMLQSIADIGNGKRDAVSLENLGELYLQKMATPRFRWETWKKTPRVLREYLEDKKNRDEKVLRLMINRYQ